MNGVPSLYREFAVFELLEKYPGLTAQEIRKKLGADKSQLQGLLTTLYNDGSLEREPAGRGYRYYIKEIQLCVRR